VINLHENHNVTLSQAYQVATRQFIRLRAINEIANFAAEEEALAYGQDVRGSGSSRKAFVRTWRLLAIGAQPEAYQIISLCVWFYIGPILRSRDACVTHKLHFICFVVIGVRRFHCERSTGSIPLRSQPTQTPIVESGDERIRYILRQGNQGGS
jgi:hypothetical protein